MDRRNVDPDFDPEQIENEDPTGEIQFEAEGFQDAPDGGPDFTGVGEDEGAIDKPPARGGQKVAGIPEREQKEQNTPSAGRPDSEGFVLRERAGDSKGDPAVGGTRPD